MIEQFNPYHRWLGISPKDQPPNHYRLLGIDLFESDTEVVRDGAERQMAHVRNYALGQYADLSQRILNELASAKACLLDPCARAAYDKSLTQALSSPTTRATLPPSLAPPLQTLPLQPAERHVSPPLDFESLWSDIQGSSPRLANRSVSPLWGRRKGRLVGGLDTLAWKWLLSGALGLLVMVALGDFILSRETNDDALSGSKLALISDPALPRKVSPSKEITVNLDDGVTLKMSRIPAGEFMMGSSDLDKDSSLVEKPQHQVRITKPFYLGNHEVTQEQWIALMGNNPSRFKHPKNPVENVSWDDCQAFLRKLNEKCAGPGTTFGLPTEAQWEYACRVGNVGSYGFGDAKRRLEEYSWFGRNSCGTTHPVGERKPNAWGLYDMHGNVWEWCADRYEAGYHGHFPAEDPIGSASGSCRVLRGGSWLSGPSYCRSANRNNSVPSLRNNNVGFRVSRTP